MDDTRFKREVEAYAALQELLRQAGDVQRRFVAAGLIIPAPLARLLGEDEPISHGGPANRVSFVFAPAVRPDIAQSGWIWVPLEQLLLQDVVLAILRTSDQPLPIKELCARVLTVRPGMAEGSIYNIGPRLDGKLIQRDRDHNTWALVDPSQAPLIDGDYAWGPREIFGDQSVAAYRRNLILEAVTELPSGLTVMQLVDKLRDCDAPVDKDLIKADLLALRAKGLVKKGFQRKWSLVIVAK